MEQRQKKEVTFSLLGTFIIFLLLYIPLVLYSQGHFILVSFYICLISIGLIWFNRNNIKRNIDTFSIERNKLKYLEYYHITDDNKVIDSEKRKSTYSLFRDMTSGTMLIFIFNLFSIIYLLKCFFGESAVINMITLLVMLFGIFVGYGGLVVGVIHKYTTATYVLIPMFSGIIYGGFIDPILVFLPDFVRLIGYILITLLLYCALVCFFPVHYLRKLNSKTVLISSFLTILATFITPILLFCFSNYIEAQNQFLTIYDVKAATDISVTLKNIIIDNPELVDFINYFYKQELSNQVSSITTLIVTALTISYIVGGLIINAKIKVNKLKAKTTYRSLIKDNSKINYQSLIECSFYGGEEYENLILNDEYMRQIIFENESNLEIPDFSRKTRFISWWKRNSIIYFTINDLKQIFQI